jgi:hypothetical protein
MNEPKVEFPVITHEQLVDLFRKSQRAETGSRIKRKEARKVWKSTFRAAIEERIPMGSWALEMLEELDILKDPATSATVCPPGQKDLLSRVIRDARAEEERTSKAILQTLNLARA